MPSIKSYISFLSVITIVSCGNGNNTNVKTPAKDSGILSGTMVKNARTAAGIDTAVAAQLPTLEFKDTTHDFGTIPEDERVQYKFEFTNGGKSPLIISKATGSCGCTIADFPREPLPSGKNGYITVSFNSKDKMGPQNKSVTLNTNTKRGFAELFIQANVIDKKADKK